MSLNGRETRRGCGSDLSMAHRRADHGPQGVVGPRDTGAHATHDRGVCTPFMGPRDTGGVHPQGGGDDGPQGELGMIALLRSAGGQPLSKPSVAPNRGPACHYLKLQHMRNSVPTSAGCGMEHISHPARNSVPTSALAGKQPWSCP